MDYAYLAYGVDFDPVPMVDTIALSFPKTMTVLGSIDYRILEADSQTFLDRKDFLHEAAALLRQRDAHAGLGTDASFSFFPLDQNAGRITRRPRSLPPGQRDQEAWTRRGDCPDSLCPG